MPPWQWETEGWPGSPLRGALKTTLPGPHLARWASLKLNPSPSVGAGLIWTLLGTPGQWPVRASVWGERETLHFGVQCLETLRAGARTVGPDPRTEGAATRGP